MGMDKYGVAKYVARRSPHCTKAQVREVLENYAWVMKWYLERHEGETFLLPDIGRFSIKDVPEKSGKKGYTGEEWVVPAHKELKFTFMEQVRKLEK